MTDGAQNLPMTDSKELEFVAKALRSKRLILLVGQHLVDDAIPSTADTIRRRLKIPDGRELYDWWLTTTERLDARVSVLRELGDHAVLPESLISVARLPWNAVITSAADGVVRKALEVHPTRQIQPLFPGLGASVLRASRSPLTFAALFGAADRPTREEQPPPDRRSLQERRVEVLQLLDTLHELVGPNGALILDAWRTSDWLRPRDLAPRLFALAPGQVHLFSCDSEMRDRLSTDEDFAGLLDTGIVSTHVRSFGALLEEGIASGLIDATLTKEIDESAHEVTVRTRAGNEAILRLDRDSWSRLSRHFVILDDTETGFVEDRSDTDRFSALRTLLRATQLHHHWRDVRLLGFRRSFSDQLNRDVVKLLNSPSPQETTFVVVGQAGSGKSIALAQLALDLRDQKFPVLYVPPSSVLPDWNQIDSFATAVENALRAETSVDSGGRPYGGTVGTAVIWDGLRDPHEYLRYSEELASRGRRVLVVGSSYYPPNERRGVKGVTYRALRADVRMDASEQSRLLAHLNGIVPEIRPAVERARVTIDSNFLVALYRLLPDARSPISDRLISELRSAEDRLKAVAQQGPQAADLPVGFAETLMGRALWSALEAIAPHLLTSPAAGDAAVPAWMEDAQRLLAVVMCAGQYGISVPQELALRCVGGVGERTIRAYREATREDYSIIAEVENSDGWIDLRPRHPLEAQEIIRRRHSNPAEQMALMRMMALALRESDMVDEGNANLDCVLRLLRQVGPRGHELGVPTASPALWPDVAEIIHECRQRLRLVNSRLLLTEAHIRREWVIYAQRLTRPSDAAAITKERMVEQLREAEEAVRRAISQLPDRFYNSRSGERRFASSVHTELACVLGTRQRLIASGAASDKPGSESASELFDRARTECREARAIHSEYASFDAEFWITRDYVTLFARDESERARLIAELAELLDEADQLELSADEALKAEERRHTLAELWNDRDLAERVLSRIEQLDKPTAAVLRARAAMGGPQDSAPTASAVDEALEILGRLGDALHHDRRALLLYTRLWWLSKTKQDFFAHERLCLAFSERDWKELARLMTQRLTLETSGYSAFALFHRAWASAQLRDIRSAEADFLEIARLGAGIARRVRALAVLSEPDGTPQKHAAEVRRIEKPTRGFAWVPQLGVEVAFNPFSFELTAPRRFQAVGPVHIVLNYRGLYAENPSLYIPSPSRR